MKHIPIDTPSVSIPIFFQLQEEERYRLARALMNGPGQILANSLVELENCLPLIQADPSRAAIGISSLNAEIRTGLAQLKAFVAELQPPLLAEMGLGPSLEQYINSLGVLHGIKAECRGCDALRERLPITMETAIFRIIQEALDNILAHSGAKRFVVQMSRVDSQVRLEVRDNGQGFAPTEGTGLKRRQLGLVGMYDRARLIGGQLQVYSQVGKGTRVVLSVPYHSHDEDIVPGGENEGVRKNQTEGKKRQAARSGQYGNGQGKQTGAHSTGAQDRHPHTDRR